jgi:STE24 endopeptidase
LGHWKLGNVTKRLLGTALFLLLSLYAAARLLAWDGFSTWLGLAECSVAAQIIMLAFMSSILGFFVTPVSAFLSRQHERQADGFASGLTGKRKHLASALIKLATDNLANLHPHPWFATFYYSHPPTALRVRELLREEGQ